MSEAATPTPDEKKPRTIVDVQNEANQKLYELGVLNYQLEYEIPAKKRHLYNQISDLDKEAQKMAKQMQAMQDAMKQNGKEAKVPTEGEPTPKTSQPETTIQ